MSKKCKCEHKKRGHRCARVVALSLAVAGESKFFVGGRDGLNIRGRDLRLFNTVGGILQKSDGLNNSTSYAANSPTVV